ncbi:ABC transporter ATP-binding protein [Clavibacter sp. VKM Ac-2873]|nr:ABC transporter ATP-binding protein [Clavibacter sp. VKM Ac-2873]
MNAPTHPSPSRRGPTCVLEAVGIHKSYRTGRRGPEIPVLRDVSVRIHEGEMVAVIGPSGSGKSTLLYCLSALEHVTRGEVRMDGQDLGSMKGPGLARLRRDKIGFVFQQFNLIPSLTAAENVALPARLARRPHSPQAVDGALERVGLTGQRSRHPAELSGGQQQRVAIARVLADEPDIVFADEPTGALDTRNSRQVLALLRAAADDGRAVVMVTHDLDAASQADRVLVLRDGRLCAELPRPTVLQLLEALESSAGPIEGHGA